MKKSIYIFLLILCISAGSYFYHWKFIAERDILETIDSWSDIIKALDNQEIKQGVESDTLLTTLSDKKYAIEFLDFCYQLNDIESLRSPSFIEMIQIQPLATYMSENNISDPAECMATQYLELDGLKQECTFNEDNGLHNPYLAAYINGTIQDERFLNSLDVFKNFYLDVYPSNAYSIWAVKDKLEWSFNSKQYCNDIVENNYQDFIRDENEEIHIYSWDNDNVLITEDKNTTSTGTTQQNQETINQ